MDYHQPVFSSQKDATLRGVFILWMATTTLAIPLTEMDKNKLPINVVVKAVEGGKHQPIPPGSDKSLYNVDLIEGDIVKLENTLRNAVADRNHTWDYGAIIYKVDDNVGCPESPQCKILSKAMNHYHTKSCIRFKEWTGEENYVRIFFNTENSGACWSPVGKVGIGEQSLSLGQRCWYFGIVVHELGHSIGFWHEMNRPDRDRWIYIYWNNIIENFSPAFEIQDERTVDTLEEPFDYKSIMMYDEYAFSKDGVSPTLQAKTNEEIGPIWKKTGLSDSDVRRLHKLYKCRGNKPKKNFPYDIICDFNSHTCGFKNGPVLGWYWKTVNETDGYVYTSYETSGTTLTEFTSVNFHPVNTRYSRNSLGCIKFSYLIQGDGTSSLKLSHLYLDKVTQLDVNSDATFELWISGTLTSNWTYIEIPLYITRPFKISFQSQFEEDATYGTIGIDNIEISYSPCSEDKTTDPTMTTTEPIPITTEITSNQVPVDPQILTTLPPTAEFQTSTLEGTTISNDVL